jgi:DNA-binding MarR family transcriptional regulator
VTKPSLPVVHAAVSCLRQLTDIFRQRRQELAAGVGLSEQQWAVLDEIANEDFMPSMFARQRDSSAAAVSKILRQLQDKALVVASVSESDARQRNYELTESGRDTLDRVRAERQRAIDEVWCSFDRERLQAFTELGNQLIERLERHSRLNVARRESEPPAAIPAVAEHVVVGPSDPIPPTSSSPARRGQKDNGTDPVRQGV